MWPLLASIIALGVVIGGCCFSCGNARDHHALEVLHGSRSGDTAGIAISKSKFFVVRALGYTLSLKETS
jgi:hypothetical protein